MEIGNFAQWGSLILAGLAFVISMFAGNRKALSERFAKAEEKIEKIDDRVAKLEGEINHLPDKNSFHIMQLAMSEMRGDLNVMVERLKPVAAISERLQEFLVQQGSRE